MKCAYHPESDAIGICMACERGVCAECAVDMDRGLACKDRCEPEVRRLLDLRDFSFSQPHYFETRVKASRIGRAIGVGWGMVAGMILIVAGYIQGQRAALIAGGVVVGVTAIILIATRRSSVRTDQFRLCPKCGYNMTGNTTGKCPECGCFV